MRFNFTLPNDESSRHILAGIVKAELAQNGINVSEDEALTSFDAFEAAVNAGDYEALREMPGWNTNDGMEYYETLDAIAYSTLTALGLDS